MSNEVAPATTQGRTFQSHAKKPLFFASLVVLAYFVVEITGAVISGSLALFADAAHTVSDVAALGMALGAAWLAGRPGTATRTFGYLRAEVLAALANGALLLGIACVIFIEAGRRLAAPPEVEGFIVSTVATGGIAANGVAALILMRGAKGSMNVRAALFHVLGDALGSAGAVVAGLLIALYGWQIADPAVSVFIGLLLVVGALRVLKEAVHVLLEGVPGHVDMPALLTDIKHLPDVLDVHDLHTWTLTSGYHAMSAHVTMCEGVTRSQEGRLLAELRQMAAERYQMAHVTVQLERGDPACEEEGHLPGVLERQEITGRGNP